MHYTKEWKEAERLVGNILVTHSHSWEGPSWEPGEGELLQAIVSFAALDVPGCVSALKAERTAIYDQMRKSVTAFMEKNGEDPVAILCNRRDLQLAEAPYDMTVVGTVDPEWGGPKPFLFQGTPVNPWRTLHNNMAIRAVDKIELEYATGRR